jgi:hypothetical protein
MRRHLPVATATFLLAVTAALAQAPATPPPEGTAAPSPNPVAGPQDRPATGTVPTVPGLGGDAPSEELTKMGDPVEPGAPGVVPEAQDAPAAMNPEGTRQSEGSATTAPPVPEPSGIGAEEALAAIGKPARTSDGREAGTVRDFVLTNPQGPIGHVVVENGEAGGTGMIALPAGDIAGIDEDGVRLNATADEMAQAPAFDYGPGTTSLAGPR